VNLQLKYFLLIAISVLLLSVESFAQFTGRLDSLRKAHPMGFNEVLKTNPLPILWGPILLTGEYRLTYESVTSPKQSWQVSGSYLGKSLIFWAMEDSLMGDSIPDIKISGWRFQLSYKFYTDPNLKAPNGIYFAPLISYSHATMWYEGYSKNLYNLKATYIFYGLTLGKQYIKNDRALDFFIGVGYRDVKWTETYKNQLSKLETDDFIISKSPIKFICGFNFGKAF